MKTLFLRYFVIIGCCTGTSLFAQSATSRPYDPAFPDRVPDVIQPKPYDPTFPDAQPSIQYNMPKEQPMNGQSPTYSAPYFNSPAPAGGYSGYQYPSNGGQQFNNLAPNQNQNANPNPNQARSGNNNAQNQGGGNAFQGYRGQQQQNPPAPYARPFGGFDTGQGNIINNTGSSDDLIKNLYFNPNPLPPLEDIVEPYTQHPSPPGPSYVDPPGGDDKYMSLMPDSPINLPAPDLSAEVDDPLSYQMYMRDNQDFVRQNQMFDSYTRGYEGPQDQAAAVGYLPRPQPRQYEGQENSQEPQYQQDQQDYYSQDQGYYAQNEEYDAYASQQQQEYANVNVFQPEYYPQNPSFDTNKYGHDGRGKRNPSIPQEYLAPQYYPPQSFNSYRTPYEGNVDSQNSLGYVTPPTPDPNGVQPEYFQLNDRTLIQNPGRGQYSLSQAPDIREDPRFAQNNITPERKVYSCPQSDKIECGKAWGSCYLEPEYFYVRHLEYKPVYYPQKLSRCVPKLYKKLCFKCVPEYYYQDCCKMVRETTYTYEKDCCGNMVPREQCVYKPKNYQQRFCTYVPQGYYKTCWKNVVEEYYETACRMEPYYKWDIKCVMVPRYHEMPDCVIDPSNRDEMVPNPNA